jgi:hypothetical protein
VSAAETRDQAAFIVLHRPVESATHCYQSRGQGFNGRKQSIPAVHTLFLEQQSGGSAAIAGARPMTW